MRRTGPLTVLLLLVCLVPTSVIASLGISEPQSSLGDWVSTDVVEPSADPLAIPPAVADRPGDGSSVLIALWLLVTAIGVSMYCLPSIVARHRQHHQRGAIYVINICLGWTLLGWVIALAMAASRVQSAPPTAPSPPLQ